MKATLQLLIFSLFLMSYGQKSIKYVDYTDQLQRKDTIQNLAIAIENWEIPSFNNIDFSPFTDLKKVRLQIFNYYGIEDNDGNLNEKMVVFNPSFSSLTIDFLELTAFTNDQSDVPKIVFDESFKNLPITTLQLNLNDDIIFNLPPFFKKLADLKAIHFVCSENVDAISIENINTSQIETISIVGGDVYKPKEVAKKLYKFKNLKQLTLNHLSLFESLNPSKFKQLETLESGAFTQKQLTNIFEAKHLKSLRLDYCYDCDENLSIRGIEKLKELEEFEIQNPILINELCLLTQNKSLQKLGIGGVQYDEQKFNPIPCSEALKKLSKLDLGANAYKTQFLLKHKVDSIRSMNYDGVYQFRNGLTKKWGMYQLSTGENSTNFYKELVPIQFDSISKPCFNCPVTAVYQKENVGFYALSYNPQKNGKLTVPCIYDSYKLYDHRGKTFIAVQKAGKWGWINWATGKEESQFTYDTPEDLPFPSFKQEFRKEE